MKNIVHRGITWRDFPGNRDTLMRRIDFAQFKRGVHPYNAACGDLEGAALKQKLHELAAAAQKQFAAVSVFRRRRMRLLKQQQSQLAD